jgi:hypothetical protein
MKNLVNHIQGACQITSFEFSPHGGIFDGPGQISMALPVKLTSGFAVLEY